MKQPQKQLNISPKSKTITIILFVFLCYLGGHNWYVKKFKDALYIIIMELLAIILISVKLIIIASYYQGTIYGKGYYFFNIIGTLGYVLFILVILKLFKDLQDILLGKFTDNNNMFIN